MHLKTGRKRKRSIMHSIHNMKKRKICVVTNSRSDYVRLKTVMLALKARADVELVTIVLGSHLLSDFGSTVNLLIEDGFVPNYRIFSKVDGNEPVSMARSVGLATNDLATIFYNEMPHIVVVHGDRYETLAVTSAAALMNIHVAHIQGGEVTGTIDEHIRHAVTKLAHFHFPSNKDAAVRIERLGEEKKNIFNLGCPSIDLIQEAKVMSFKELKKALSAYVKKEEWLDSFTEDFFLVLEHPVTTEFADTKAHFKQVFDALGSFDNPIMMLWPNVDAGGDALVELIKKFEREHHTQIGVFDNFPNDIFVNLMRHASVMIGNSSSGVREASYLGTPVVNVGNRQSGRERTKNVIDVPYDAKLIQKAIDKQLKHSTYKFEKPYGTGNSGKRIAQKLATIKLSNIQKQITF